MVAEIDFKSIPAAQSLTVFEGRCWSLQKLDSCFHIVVHSFGPDLFTSCQLLVGS